MKREFMRLRYVRCAVPGIGRVYGRPGILRAFPFLQHPHDILCNIHADGTAEGVVVEDDRTLCIHARNIAGVIRRVTDISTTAIAGNVFHDVRVRGGELIGRLHRHGCGLNFCGHLIYRHHV